MIEPGTKVVLVDNESIPEPQKKFVGKIGVVSSSSDQQTVVTLSEPIENISHFVAPTSWLERRN